MVRKICIISIIIVMAVLHVGITAAAISFLCNYSTSWGACEHCGTTTLISDHLLDGVDVTICDSCYAEFLNGKWEDECSHG